MRTLINLFAVMVLCVLAGGDTTVVVGQKPATAGPITTNTWITSYVSPTGSSSGLMQNNGLEMTIGASDIVVTDLGCWYVTGAFTDWDVEIKDSSCMVVASVTIEFDTAVVDSFNYTNIASPVTLLSGQTYYVILIPSAFNAYRLGGTPSTTGDASYVTWANGDCENTDGVLAHVNFKYYIP